MKRRDGGFTLLEVLVAFTVAALALVALLQGGVTGLTTVDLAGRTAGAVALARSHLELFAALGTPAAEALEGDEGEGFHWQLRVDPIDQIQVTGPPRTKLSPTTLYRVGVTVSWASGRGRRSVRLESERLTAPPLLP